MITFKKFLNEVALPAAGEMYVLKTDHDCARERGGSTYLSAGTEVEVIRIENQNSPFGAQVIYRTIYEPGTYREGTVWFARTMFKGTKSDFQRAFLDDLYD